MPAFTPNTMFARITSLQNKHIKHIVKLRRRRYRDAHRLTVVEGAREIRLALAQDIVPQEAYICFSLLAGAESENILAALRDLAQKHNTRLYEVTAEVFARIAYRGESGGMLLVIPYLQHDLSGLPTGHAALLTVIENAEKPGNLGAILRTADAAGVDGVLLCASGEGSGTDVHNPNVVRASLGALFSVPVATASTEQAIEWLRQRNVHIIISTPAAKGPYTEVDMTRPIALVMGGEAQGLSDAWFAADAERVAIPMKGSVDSLNLAVATAILLYEARRQRSEIEEVKPT